MNIRVRITATGQVLTLDIEEYLRGVVPNESPASWPMEELKAQAVAARTYALAQTGILADDERSQVYRPNSMNPRTDEAIRMTHSIVGRYQGAIKPMFFSASCGGVTLGTWGPWLKHLTNCPCKAAGYGTNGHQQGMCQQGARVLATQGMYYTDILNTYYNMSFSPLNEAATVTPPSKISIQYQTIPAWANQIKLPWQKVIDPGGTDTWPGSKTVGRFWVEDDNQINKYLALGAPGADQYFNRCLPMYRSAPWIYVWEGPNEPQPMSDNLYVVASAAFWSRYVDLMHGAGLKVCIGSWGVTWPHVDQITLFKDALTKTDYWSTHEYGAPTMQSSSGDNCLHYRRLIAALRAASCRVPPLLITECGIDGGCAGQGGCGWRMIVPATSREQYQAQIAWYNTETLKDYEVEQVFLFVAGPKPLWVSFVIDEVLARWVMNTHAFPVTFPVDQAALEKFLGDHCQKTIIPLDKNSAFQKFAQPRGWLPAGLCPDIVYNSVMYSVQPYRSPNDTSVQYIVWCKTGDWGNVKFFIRSN